MMNWLKRVLFLLVLVAALLIGILFGYENQESVELVIMGFSIEGFSLGFIVTFSLLIGALLGYVLSLWSVMKAKAQTRSLKKQISNQP